MALVGIAWASILSMPYAMLSNAIPAAKMGFYMGVFNFFIVLPQILASTSLGWVVEHVLDGRGLSVVALGGVSLLVAAASLAFVHPEPVAAGPDPATGREA
jgi:maltose/moltooligosaccharide transporter